MKRVWGCVTLVVFVLEPAGIKGERWSGRGGEENEEDGEEMKPDEQDRVKSEQEQIVCCP